MLKSANSQIYPNLIRVKTKIILIYIKVHALAYIEALQLDMIKTSSLIKVLIL